MGADHAVWAISGYGDGSDIDLGGTVMAVVYETAGRIVEGK